MKHISIALTRKVPKCHRCCARACLKWLYIFFMCTTRPSESNQIMSKVHVEHPHKECTPSFSNLRFMEHHTDYHLQLADGYVQKFKVKTLRPILAYTCSYSQSLCNIQQCCSIYDIVRNVVLFGIMAAIGSIVGKTR